MKKQLLLKQTSEKAFNINLCIIYQKPNKNGLNSRKWKKKNNGSCFD